MEKKIKKNKNQRHLYWIIYIFIVFSAMIIISAWQTSSFYARNQEFKKARAFLVTSDDPYLGSPTAKVHIVEFSDFQCPFCQKSSLITKELLKIYGDRIHFIYRDFPVLSHSYAQRTAEAGECAQDQGKFWEMHDKIFENQKDLRDIKKIASDVGLDMTKFNECFDAEKYRQEVLDDYSAGEKTGVTGTPTFFINGEIVQGAVPIEVMMDIIERKLQGDIKK